MTSAGGRLLQDGFIDSASRYPGVRRLKLTGAR